MNPPIDGSQIHPALEADGGRSVFWGRTAEICVRESGRRSFHQTGNTLSPLQRTLHRMSRNRRWAAVAVWPDDPADCNSFRRRNDCSHTLNEDFLVPGNVSVASAAGASPSRVVGCVTRDPIRLRADSDGDRKSTRLNSSHVAISYAVFCLKKKKKKKHKHSNEIKKEKNEITV